MNYLKNLGGALHVVNSKEDAIRLHWEVRVQAENFWGSHYFQGNAVSSNYYEAKIEKDVNVVNK